MNYKVCHGKQKSKENFTSKAKGGNLNVQSMKDYNLSQWNFRVFGSEK